MFARFSLFQNYWRCKPSNKILSRVNNDAWQQGTSSGDLLNLKWIGWLVIEIRPTHCMHLSSSPEQSNSDWKLNMKLHFNIGHLMPVPHRWTQHYQESSRRTQTISARLLEPSRLTFCPRTESERSQYRSESARCHIHGLDSWWGCRGELIECTDTAVWRKHQVRRQIPETQSLQHMANRATLEMIENTFKLNET